MVHFLTMNRTLILRREFVNKPPGFEVEFVRISFSLRWRVCVFTFYYAFELMNSVIAQRLVDFCFLILI